MLESPMDWKSQHSKIPKFHICGVLESIVCGEMSEWFKEHAWKACVGVTPPWVRIPLSPLKLNAASIRFRGAAQLEPENPARSGRKQRYWVNQCDAVSPEPVSLLESSPS